MHKSLRFSSALFSFLKIFSSIRSYDRPMLFCIKVSISEPISIRYTQKSLIQYGNTVREQLLHIGCTDVIFQNQVCMFCLLQGAAHLDMNRTDILGCEKLR